MNTCPGALVILRPELWVSRSYSTASRKRCLSVRRLGVGCREKVPSSGSCNSAGIKQHNCESVVSREKERVDDEEMRAMTWNMGDQKRAEDRISTDKAFT